MNTDAFTMLLQNRIKGVPFKPSETPEKRNMVKRTLRERPFPPFKKRRLNEYLPRSMAIEQIAVEADKLLALRTIVILAVFPPPCAIRQGDLHGNHAHCICRSHTPLHRTAAWCGYPAHGTSVPAREFIRAAYRDDRSRNSRRLLPKQPGGVPQDRPCGLAHRSFRAFKRACAIIPRACFASPGAPGAGALAAFTAACASAGHQITRPATSLWRSSLRAATYAPA